MTTSLKKRGRRPFNFEWPEGPFTVSLLSMTLNQAISKVSIYSKINNALKNGEILLVRKTKSPIGRPESIYNKASGVKGVSTEKALGMDSQNET